MAESSEVVEQLQTTLAHRRHDKFTFSSGTVSSEIRQPQLLVETLRDGDGFYSNSEMIDLCMLTLNFHRADDDLFGQRIRSHAVNSPLRRRSGSFAVAESVLTTRSSTASRSIATSRISQYAPVFLSRRLSSARWASYFVIAAPEFGDPLSFTRHGFHNRRLSIRAGTARVCRATISRSTRSAPSADRFLLMTKISAISMMPL